MEEFFERAVQKYAAAEADRAERYRQMRYAKEQQLIEDAIEEVERLTGLLIPYLDWTVFLPEFVQYDFGANARAEIVPERNVTLYYFAKRVSVNTGPASRVIGVRTYTTHYGKRYCFRKPISRVEDLGELCALPPACDAAMAQIAARYPDYKTRPIDVRDFV